MYKKIPKEKSKKTPADFTIPYELDGNYYENLVIHEKIEKLHRDQLKTVLGGINNQKVNGRTYFMYCVPLTSSIPHYDYRSSLRFLIDSLRKRKLGVFFKNPNQIHIFWEDKAIKERDDEKLSKFIEEEMKNTVNFLKKCETYKQKKKLSENSEEFEKIFNNLKNSDENSESEEEDEEDFEYQYRDL